ncbi:cysteine hydrolase family protein [Pseudonocardia halophobica]|uniref:Isochorismatase n=1 Tax=Pseudonocardia halophobica TaxID=29401 RepID=A0A9W6LDD7_9PSEU|nr:cysteine hydrolase family protein [Pseudonocardia halophobica]GLL14709.1 isochorismatase [Pseudonocardia halophobica]
MSDLTTLRAVSGLPADPPALSASTLVLIDCQNTYTRGLMELEGVQAALDQAEELLDRARAAGIPIVHVQHDAGRGTPYDVREEIGAIVARVAPRSGEATVVKHYPNSFTGTELDTLLKQHPARPLLLAGFMTHMCVNSTARGAFSLGYAPTVVGGATATRALPGTGGGPEVSAAALQAASLAAVADLFGVVVADQREIPD